MVVTIKLQNQQEYQWLLPLLERLKRDNITVEVKGNFVENDLVERKKAFFNYIQQNPIHIESIGKLPNREERNAR